MWRLQPQWRLMMLHHNLQVLRRMQLDHQQSPFSSKVLDKKDICFFCQKYIHIFNFKTEKSYLEFLLWNTFNLPVLALNRRVIGRCNERNTKHWRELCKRVPEKKREGDEEKAANQRHSLIYWPWLSLWHPVYKIEENLRLVQVDHIVNWEKDDGQINESEIIFTYVHLSQTSLLRDCERKDESKDENLEDLHGTNFRVEFVLTKDNSQLHNSHSIRTS